MTLTSRMDRGDLFLKPVNIAEVPDYLNVVSEPMCWLDIDDKLEQNTYLNVDEFRVGWCTGNMS